MLDWTLDSNSFRILSHSQKYNLKPLYAPNAMCERLPYVVAIFSAPTEATGEQLCTLLQPILPSFCPPPADRTRTLSGSNLFIPTG